MNPWKTKRYFKYMYKMLHLNVKPAQISGGLQTGNKN